MNLFIAWLQAARLRTLPLSVSGIIVGASMASADFFKTTIFWLAIMVTIGFQILSNFANDYGDAVKGADNNRKGEKRMVSSGIISKKQMQMGMVVLGGVTFFIASLLIFIAFGYDSLFTAFIFFNLTIICIIAALKYTVGKNPYGYLGLGDAFVFLFFGVVSVLGTYYLYAQNLSWYLLLPAITIGCFSVAVLNLNNLRDYETDKAVGKNTIVVKLGIKKAKQYHYALLILGMLTSIIYALIFANNILNLLYGIVFLPLLINIKTVQQNKEPSKLDGELKKVALSTFLFALLFAIFNVI